MNEPWLPALMLAAATVGSLHSLAPDHWVPFAALSRARGWTAARTARLAFLCGFGHVTVSALLGVFAVIIGRETVEVFGTTVHSAAPMLLIVFGFVYMLWALWRNFSGRILHHAHHLEGVPHDHGHGVHRHDHGGHRLSAWGLFLLFCADPCVALIPMIVAASVGGWGAVLAVIIVYEIATIGAIIILVHFARAGATKIRLPWLDRYSDVAAGALILILGATIVAIEM